MNECIDAGFITDVEKESYSCEVYNADGYSLKISHISDELSITVEAPMELGTISWPTGIAGSLVPAPKSTTGKFNYEYDTHFSVYVGDTSKDDYNEYVTKCSDSGFNVDYSKSENYYSAYNADGYYLSISYEGNNIMCVHVDEPDEDEVEESTEATETTAPAETTTPAPTETTAPTESNTSTATMGEKNALASAKSYLDYTAFSYTGLIDQLEFEGYSTEDATYAVDNCGADWNEQAKKSAQSYTEYMSFSRDGLIEQLEYEGFTAEQAEYGVSAIGY